MPVTFCLPELESLGHFLAVLGGGESVALRSEVLSNGTVRREETLRFTGRCKPLDPPLLLSRRLIRVLRTIIQVLVAVFHAG